ncbi:SA1788 family PVL leukocidin-associated protein [Staphylococcus epidermidis]|nr:SA1788 family PVL leukocidin-associated protein [Staphylococcus epidermidis]MDH9906494.1 SA1788 family PVL leukocidin-associated protein [Staphylococcus epidermidis]MDI0104082.1 SA1788 family PVL leukocidin-associated protein [Staphylococcus epidermidis]
MELAKNRTIEFKNNRLYYVVKTEEQKHLLPVEDVHEAEYTGTPWKLIVRRIKYSGYSPEEALFEEYNEQDTEAKERKQLSQMEHEDRMRLVRLERQKELNLRRKKPHLFEVPQVHSRSEWCNYLMKNDIFPRKVVRS